MMIENFDLKEYLLTLNGSYCQLLRFPGNYGDAFIWHGTKNLLAQAGIEYETLECHHVPSAGILLIDGGGNLNDFYTDITDYLTKYSSILDQVVILPHTISGSRSMECLATYCPRATIFCRDLKTFTAVSTCIPFADVRLAHDCAFESGVNSFKKTSKINDEFLFAFRQDVESIYTQLPSTNRDLSKEGYAMSPIDDFVQVISSHKTIHTDRLHIAIVATMLDKDVYLYPNSYFKNNAVFKNSLSRFANIKFVKCS